MPSKSATSAWRARSKKHISEYNAQYYKNNKENILAHKKGQRPNPVSIANTREWKRRNPARVKSYARVYREQNRERALVSERKRAGIPAPTRPEPATCEICNCKPSGIYKHLCVDHDHNTGKFRGWLCNRCNLALGNMGDTLESVERVTDYLRRASGA